MSVFKNCYQVLGLADFAEADSVKAAFRQLARQHHPDLNQGDPTAEERFKAINAAYEMLSNPAKRDWHDRCLRAVQTGNAPKPSSGKPGKKPPSSEEAAKSTGTGQKTSKKNATDSEKSTASSAKGVSDRGQANTFTELFDGLLKKGFPSEKESVKERSESGPADTTFKEARSYKKKEDRPRSEVSHVETEAGLGEGFFGRVGGHHADSKREPARRGEDVTVKTVISPQEAAEGLIKSVQVQHQEICRRCSGTGRVNGASCTACHGEKGHTRLRKMDVRIPAGVKTGSKVRVAREGERGAGGGENGDLFLQIEVAYDPSLRIEKLDVHGEVSISVTEAVLGAEIEVPTLNGLVKMMIPPGTQPGRTFRLKERGVQSGGATGDHFVTIALIIPNNLSHREKELYQELGHLRPRKSK